MRTDYSIFSEQFYTTGMLYAHYHWHPQHRYPQGHAFWNYPSGFRMVEGYYDQGIRAGKWRWFAEDCEVLKIVEFGDGEYRKLIAPSDFAIERCTPENTIILDEEYGYRQWLWVPDRSMTEIEIWWRELHAVSPWSSSIDKLPGYLVEATDTFYNFWSSAYDSGDYLVGHLNEDDDSWLKKPSGEWVYHHNYYLIKNIGLC